MIGFIMEIGVLVVDRARNALSNPEMADFCDFQDRQWETVWT